MTYNFSGANRFRVVRVYYRLPPEPGGMEAHIERLSTSQRELGIEVVNLFNVGVAGAQSVKIFPEYNLRGVRPSVLRNAVFYAGALAVRKELKGNLPTVLHVHGDWSDLIYSKVLARAIGASVVAASFHGTVGVQMARRYRFGLSHCELIFSTGKSDQVYLQGLLGREVYHMPSAPLPKFFESPVYKVESNCDVLAVANFFPIKRVDIILDCAARRPQLRFVVYGDGPERAAIMSRAVERNIQNIIFPGRCSQTSISESMHRAKLFLLTSQQEGSPTAALEAMASGLPVILTPSNDYDWLVESGVNGFVTSSWEVSEIVARIDEVLASEKRRFLMSEASRKLAQKYTWRSNALRVSTLMSDRLGGTK